MGAVVDAEEPISKSPNNPIETVWGNVQLALTILATPIWIYLNKDNIWTVLLPIAAFDDLVCPSIESIGFMLLFAVVAMLHIAYTMESNCVRLLTGNFVAIIVAGNDADDADAFPVLDTFVPVVWYLSNKYISITNIDFTNFNSIDQAYSYNIEREDIFF